MNVAALVDSYLKLPSLGYSLHNCRLVRDMHA